MRGIFLFKIKLAFFFRFWYITPCRFGSLIEREKNLKKVLAIE